MNDVAAIQRLLDPPWVTSADGWRHSLRNMPARARDHFVVACVDDAVAGFARAYLDHTSDQPGDANLRLNVHPEFRRRGIGSALFTEAMRHFGEVSAAVIRLWVPNNPESGKFAESRGFQPRRQLRSSSLDPRVLPPMPQAPAGVTLVDFATAGPDAIYNWDIQAGVDEPRDTTTAPNPKDEWVRLYWEDPDHRPDLGTAAIVDGKVVAGTAVEADGDRSVSGFTGVLPEFRGRGLAKLVKSASLRKVAAAGVTRAYTSNDEENAPMLAVNEWLGYRPVFGQTQWRLTLSA